MNINLKFTAKIVDEIEQAKKMPIENCITDTSVNSLALFLQKGMVDDNGNIGVSRAVALDKIDEYLEENDKNNLIMDIMEALVDAGFLSRDLNVKQLRALQSKQTEKVTAQIENSLL